LMGFGGIGLAWMLQPDNPHPAAALRAAGLVFLAVLAAALAVDPPMAGYGAAVIDRLSVVWVGLALATVAIGMVLVWCDRVRPRTTAMTLAGAGAAVAALGLWLAAFPAVAKGPAGLMPPEMAKAFFANIAEMMPIGSALDAMTFLTSGVLGLAVLLLLAWRRRSVLVLYAALCAVVTLVLAVLHVRFSTYPALVGAALLPVALTEAGAWLKLRLLLLVGFLLVPPAAAVLGARSPDVTAARPCPVAAVAPLLAPYAGEVVMANPNETPELLYHTGVKTVGSLYHRNAAAFIRLSDAWRDRPGTTVPDAMAATGATLILVCPHQARSKLVTDLPYVTVFDALNDGLPPPWLRQLGTSAASGHVLYRVIR
jgi:hypothetical protein